MLFFPWHEENVEIFLRVEFLSTFSVWCFSADGIQVVEDNWCKLKSRLKYNFDNYIYLLRGLQRRYYVNVVLKYNIYLTNVNQMRSCNFFHSLFCRVQSEYLKLMRNEWPNYEKKTKYRNFEVLAQASLNRTKSTFSFTLCTDII